MTTISPELRRAIEEGGGRPTHLVDPETNAAYVLIRVEHFERLQSLLDDEADPRDLHSATEQVFGREGWDDPIMDAYDSLMADETSRPT